MNPCNHSTPSEFRVSPDRFVSVEDALTLEETLDRPLNLTRMPSDINSMSPTPLDPYSLRINGAQYTELALAYMFDAMNRAATNIPDAYDKDVVRAQLEVEYQHTHRMNKNHEAMTRWREYAATNPSEKRLSHSEAEGVLQVRAGVSKIGALVILLAKNPDIRAIEISKATRPFCATAHGMAKIALGSDLIKAGSMPELDIDIDLSAKPYRYSIDEHHGALITKSLLGSAQVNETEIEIVGRESGLLYRPDPAAQIPESQTRMFGPHEIDMVPIDMTSYARIKSA